MMRSTTDGGTPSRVRLVNLQNFRDAFLFYGLIVDARSRVENRSHVITPKDRGL